MDNFGEKENLILPNSNWKEQEIAFHYWLLFFGFLKWKWLNEIRGDFLNLFPHHLSIQSTHLKFLSLVFFFLFSPILSILNFSSNYFKKRLIILVIKKINLFTLQECYFFEMIMIWFSQNESINVILKIIFL